MSNKYLLLISLFFLFSSISCINEDENDNNSNIIEPVSPEQSDSTGYAIVKWENTEETYFLGNNGYLFYIPRTESRPSQVDAMVNDECFHFYFDSEDRLVDLKSSIISLHIDYATSNDENECDVLYGVCYGNAFKIQESQVSASAKANQTRTGIRETATNWLLNNVKTPIVQRGINKSLNIEFNSKDNPSDAFRKNALRGTVAELIDMADKMNVYSDYKDMKAIEIVNQVENQYPDMGGVQYLFAGVSEFSTVNLVGKLGIDLIMKWIKKIQDGNRALIEDRTVSIEKPLVLFGIDTWCYPEVYSCEIGIGGSLEFIGGLESAEFEYGICVSEENTSISPSDFYKIGGFLLGEKNRMSVHLPSSYIVKGLKKQTRYLCRAYCHSLSDNSYIFEDGHYFTTQGLIEQNNAYMEVSTSKFIQGVNDVYFYGYPKFSKPEIANVEEWGIYINEKRDKGTFRNYYKNNEQCFAIIARNLMYDINVETHTAKANVEIGVWAKIKDEESYRVSLPKTQEMIYDHPISITFVSSSKNGETYNATGSYYDENGVLRNGVAYGLSWQDWKVNIKVSGALFIDKLQYVINQYEFLNGSPNESYPDGLIYCKGTDAVTEDGETSITVRQLACPTGSYSIGGKTYTNSHYVENWEWYQYKCSNHMFHSNAIHFYHDKQFGIEFVDNFDAEITKFFSNNDF